MRQGKAMSRRPTGGFGKLLACRMLLRKLVRLGNSKAECCNTKVVCDTT